MTVDETQLEKSLRQRVAGVMPVNYSATRVIRTLPPEVPATVPTVTTTTSTTTSITNAQAFWIFLNPSVPSSPISPRFRFWGPPVQSRFQSSRGYAAPKALYPTTVFETLEFWTNASIYEFQVLGQAGIAFQVYEDGAPVTSSSIAGPTSGGIIKVDHTSAGGTKWRQVRYVYNSAGIPFGVNVGPTDSFMAGAAPASGTMLTVGDSFVGGANGVTPPDTYPFLLGELLGFRNHIADGIGGTGFAATGGGDQRSSGSLLYKAQYRPRLEYIRDNYGITPDLVFLQGSTNDKDGGATSFAPNLAAEVIACAQLVRAAWPNALLVTSGSMIAKGSNFGHPDDSISNQMQQTVANNPGLYDLYVDPRSTYDTWFTGAGTTAAPTGSGNCDIYMSSDSIHPSGPATTGASAADNGHKHLAIRLASAIAPLLDAQSAVPVTL